MKKLYFTIEKKARKNPKNKEDHHYDLWEIKCPHCGFIKYLHVSAKWKSNQCPHCSAISKLPDKIIKYNNR